MEAEEVESIKVAHQKEEFQFYCVVCDDFFESERDGTGYHQAPCPTCGDLSNSAHFHVGEMQRLKDDKSKFWGGIVSVFFPGVRFVASLFTRNR